MGNTSKFTAAELQALRAPFPLDQHTIREGYRPYDNALTWFVWVERTFIQDRLDSLFPGEWETPRPELRHEVYQETANNRTKTSIFTSATVGITIRGITRWDGSDSEADEGTKSALTNGFRRAAAYGWGVARYCYDIDVEIKTGDYITTDANGNKKRDWQKRDALMKEAWGQFVTWYNRQFAPPQHWALNGGGKNINALMHSLKLSWDKVKSALEPGKTLERLSDTTLEEWQVEARIREIAGVEHG